jgi:hypothetical protein
LLLIKHTGSFYLIEASYRNYIGVIFRKVNVHPLAAAQACKWEESMCAVFEIVICECVREVYILLLTEFNIVYGYMNSIK